MKRTLSLLLIIFVLLSFSGCLDQNDVSNELSCLDQNDTSNELSRGTVELLQVTPPDTSLSTPLSAEETSNFPNLTVEEKLTWKKSARGRYDSVDAYISTLTRYETVGSLTLFVDEELADIAIHDANTDTYLFSAPYNYRLYDRSKTDYFPLVELQYSDHNGNSSTLDTYAAAVNYTVYADPDSIDNIQYWAEKIDGGVRMNFQIGSKEPETLLPYAAEVENFNAKVLNPLKEKADAGNEAAEEAYTKLIAFYSRGKVFSYDELSTSLNQSISMEFPGIKEHDFYILRTSNLYNRDKLILSDYIRMSGLYTQADFERDCELSGFRSQQKTFPCFSLNVEITLESNAVHIRVPQTDYDTASYTLDDFTTLPYFGSSTFSGRTADFVSDNNCVEVVRHDGSVPQTQATTSGTNSATETEPPQQTTTTTTAPATASTWHQTLTDGYWENMIQCRKIYQFFEDGTAIEYDIEPSNPLTKENLIFSRDWRYTIDGDFLHMHSGDWTVNLQWVNKTEPYEWDRGIEHNLPSGESFFYETDWEEKEFLLDNAMYLVRVKNK